MVLRIHDIPGTHTKDGYFAGHATAGSDKEEALFRAPFACTVTAVEWTPSSNVTGDDTNYFTLTIYNRTTGAGSTVVAQLAFVTGVNATANTPKTITLSGTAANLNLAADDVITASKVHTASGLACPTGSVRVSFKAR